MSKKIKLKSYNGLCFQLVHGKLPPLFYDPFLLLSSFSLSRNNVFVGEKCIWRPIWCESLISIVSLYCKETIIWGFYWKWILVINYISTIHSFQSRPSNIKQSNAKNKISKFVCDKQEFGAIKYKWRCFLIR